MAELRLIHAEQMSLQNNFNILWKRIETAERLNNSSKTFLNQEESNFQPSEKVTMCCKGFRDAEVASIGNEISVAR